MKTTNLKVCSIFITGFLLVVLAGCGTPAPAAAPVAASSSSQEQPAEAIQFYLTADALPVEVTHGNNPVLSLTKGQTIPISTNDKIAVGDGGIGKLLYSDRITVEILQGTELVLGNVTTVAGDRIEAQIIAWGRGKESWLIDYVVLDGDTARADVWRQLTDLLGTTYRHEGGAELGITRLAIDSGWATQIASMFTSSAQRSG